MLRERFSASMFWDDIVKNECTVFIYIGELCRYLLNSPPQSAETKHKIRLACGNGLRPDIWADFQKRFRIPKILEWYAATEGNCVFLNFDGKVGAIGRIPKWMESKFFVEIVRFDIDTRAAAARAGRILRQVRAGRGRRGDLQDHERPEAAEPALRGLCRPGRDGEEDPARRLREGRPLVPHRRPDAQGRRRLLLLRRPDRRHVPLEGRERRDIGGAGGNHRAFPASRKRTSTACACRARRGASAWRRWSWSDGIDLDGFYRHVDRGACRPMRARCSCA